MIKARVIGEYLVVWYIDPVGKEMSVRSVKI